MTAKELLITNGYVFDATTLVWHRPGSDLLGYSDGDDAERKLESIVRSVSDRSVDSPAWSTAIDDWPTEYHFSPKRSNLLRPLPIGSGQRVVELGAGCGAITRWLGETGAEVIAIEGSLRRAKIAALRCQDLTNVCVVADDLHATPPFSADWVTLIGVLEYSPVFDASADPVAAVLRVAGKHLNSSGALVVAIENQLGLKYFTGCCEDHIGIPYYGVEGLYRQRGATTFGRHELSERLVSAGFSSQKLFLPFPDYKLPDIIVDAAACARPDFDVASLVALSVGRDYSGPRPKAFTEPLAWTTLTRNGLLPDLSNSFLFVVALGQAALTRCLPVHNTLAWSYSGERRIELATETCIKIHADEMRVSKRLLKTPTQPIENSTGQWSQMIEPVSDYFLGERLDIWLLRLAASGDTDGFFIGASKWFDQLLLRSQPDEEMDREQISAWTIDGHAVDLIPRNMIVGTHGKLHLFDLEWVCAKSLPLSWLLIRGVLSFALYPVNGDWIRSQTVLGLARTIAARHKISVSDGDVEVARNTDASFLAWVRGKDLDAVSWTPELLTTPIGQLTASLMDYCRAASSVAPLPTQELSRLYDEERISHAKLIGAYEQSEKSNRSLITELTKSHAFAAEALTHKSVAEQQCAANEAECAKLFFSLQQAEGRQQALLHELNNAREQAVAEQQQAEGRQQALLHELNNAREQAVAEQQQAEGRQQALLQELNNAREQAVAEQQQAEGRQQALLQELNNAREQAVAEQQQAEGRQQALLQELNNAREQAVIEQQRLHTIVNQLELQQAVINSKLIQLTAENATAGAKLGRGITRLHTRLAPVGTTRRELGSLTWQFGNSLFESGLKITGSKTWKYISSFKQSRLIRKEISKTQQILANSNVSSTPFTMARADHPELAAWIEKNEPTHEQLNNQKSEAAELVYRPLISVIIPIYRVPQEVLNDTLACLENQTYANWQACIVWSDVDDIAGWAWLQARCSTDQRFKIKLLVVNGGISRNSNAAFELVEGEFIALLDHDDTLAPWAFFDIVKLLQTTVVLDFIYSDKDSMSADGTIRLNALFKPDWSPEMLHSVNYLTHLNVIRTNIIRDIGGWRPETDGAQDWDLFFRISERTKKIARVASIHYHWRILPTSTATGLAAKPYAAIGQLKSQQDYFIRRGLAASVVPSPEGMFHVCWPVKAASTDIIVYQTGTLNQLVTVLDVMRAGKQECVHTIHVVLSTPPNDALKAFQGVWHERIVFAQMEVVNWRTALGAVLDMTASETILLVDGSATGLSETLTEELSGWVAQHPDIAWASALALNADSTVYEAGRVVSADQRSAPLFAGSPLFSFGWFGGPLWYRNTRACSPYAVAMTAHNARNAIATLHQGDFSQNAFTALCLALAADGHRGLIVPFARVYFNQSPEIDWPNDGNLFHSDPYFNPSFSLVNPLRLHS
ncbi:MAG: glycosyltransferase [Comamonadaceae bacterium]|nr:glycosyltransferase [Comamonadaceae bacterium]